MRWARIPSALAWGVVKTKDSYTLKVVGPDGKTYAFVNDTGADINNCAFTAPITGDVYVVVQGK